MPEYRYTLKQIAQATGKSNTALFTFIRENGEFIKEHSQKNGRFVKYDDEAYQAFITRFSKKVVPLEEFINEQTTPETPQEGAEPAQPSPDEEKVVDAQASIIEAFEAQIDALKKERDELHAKLEARERDCADWRAQAGQALTALSKEQERVERLEERLAGFLPAPTTQGEAQKLTFGERIRVLFWRTPKTK